MTTLITSPLGSLLAQYQDGKVVNVEFKTKKTHSPEAVDQASPITDQTAAKISQQLTEYFAGKRKRFELLLEYDGTPFQRAVWQAMQRIPYGQTLTYQQLASNIGHARASRAVANACGANPLPIIIPCHRVVASNGELGGYSSGVDKKIWLLKHEGAMG